MSGVERRLWTLICLALFWTGFLLLYLAWPSILLSADPDEIARKCDGRGGVQQIVPYTHQISARFTVVCKDGSVVKGQ